MSNSIDIAFLQEFSAWGHAVSRVRDTLELRTHPHPHPSPFRLRSEQAGGRGDRKKRRDGLSSTRNSISIAGNAQFREQMALFYPNLARLGARLSNNFVQFLTPRGEENGTTDDFDKLSPGDADEHGFWNRRLR